MLSRRFGGGGVRVPRRQLVHLSERPAGSERGASVIGVWTLSLDERVEGVGLPVERQERLSRPRPQWGHGGKAARGQMLDQRVLAADLLLGPKQTAHRDHPIPSLETEDDVARPRMDDSAVAHLVEAIVFGELVEWKLGGSRRCSGTRILLLALRALSHYGFETRFSHPENSQAPMVRVLAAGDTASHRWTVPAPLETASRSTRRSAQ